MDCLDCWFYVKDGITKGTDLCVTRDIPVDPTAWDDCEYNVPLADKKPDRMVRRDRKGFKLYN
jgi:hypothetical protein